jgi:hypothetical protein
MSSNQSDGHRPESASVLQEMCLIDDKRLEWSFRVHLLHSIRAHTNQSGDAIVNVLSLLLKKVSLFAFVSSEIAPEKR